MQVPKFPSLKYEEISVTNPRMDWTRLKAKERREVVRMALDGRSQRQFGIRLGYDPDADTWGSAERAGRVSADLMRRLHEIAPWLDEGFLKRGQTGNIPSGELKRLETVA